MARTLWWMHALGEAGLPRTLYSRGVGEMTLERTVKHYFWAATGFYRRDRDGIRVVVKINRREPALGVPLRWVGRWLCNREKRAYRALHDVPNVPALLGEVEDTGLIHDYVVGSPLSKGTPVPDDFFDALLQLVDRLAERGIAYVDTNKPENILLGEDGKPHLIDFQISFDQRTLWPPALARRVLEAFRRGDVYHCLKQKRRFRPDLLTQADLALLERAQRRVRIRRAIQKPYFAIRRPLVRWLQQTGRVADAGSH